MRLAGNSLAATLLAARLLLAWIFLLDGIEALGSYADVAAYMAANGVSPSLLPLVILLEIGAGAAVALGAFARPAAAVLAGFCVLTALFFHRSFGTAGEAIQFDKDLAIAGGFLALAVSGAGHWSLDRVRRMRAERRRFRPARKRAPPALKNAVE
jgi:putative oxidoreductase